MMPPSSAITPMARRRVLVACSAQKSESLVQGLASMGAEVVPLQVITIKEIADKSAIEAALANLAAYAWVVFTSSYGVLFFSQFMDEYGLAAGLRKQLRVCALGPATAATARECGYEVSLVPEDFVAEGVLHAFARQHSGLDGLAGMRILLPRAKEARDVLPRELAAAGALVDIVPCYETALGRIDDKALMMIRERTPDLLVFTSSSTVRNFLILLNREDEGRKILSGAPVAALGPVTAQTLESFGKKCDIVPAENTIPSLLEAIWHFYSRQ